MIVVATEMSKTPEVCSECPYMRVGAHRCDAVPEGGRYGGGKQLFVDTAYEKPIWCPLLEEQVRLEATS